MMSEKLDWTQKLGDAFLAQQKDVMATVQSLRQQGGRPQGNLKSTEAAEGHHREGRDARRSSRSSPRIPRSSTSRRTTRRSCTAPGRTRPIRRTPTTRQATSPAARFSASLRASSSAARSGAASTGVAATSTSTSTATTTSTAPTSATATGSTTPRIAERFRTRTARHRNSTGRVSPQTRSRVSSSAAAPKRDSSRSSGARCPAISRADRGHVPDRAAGRRALGVADELQRKPRLQRHRQSGRPSTRAAAARKHGTRAAVARRASSSARSSGYGGGGGGGRCRRRRRGRRAWRRGTAMKTMIRAICTCCGDRVFARRYPRRPQAQATFASPDEAVAALVKAARARDRKALLAVLGADAANFVPSGDSVADRVYVPLPGRLRQAQHHRRRRRQGDAVDRRRTTSHSLSRW